MKITRADRIAHVCLPGGYVSCEEAKEEIPFPDCTGGLVVVLLMLLLFCNERRRTRCVHTWVMFSVDT